ncbi:MAG: ACT domain-containing protein [Deltaproteobacteria bacterium]
MEIPQISIFLENRAGGLADVTDVLASNGIDIRALALADMADFGILRLIVDDPDRTRTLLKAAGFTADKTRVLAVEVTDRPGGLASILRLLRGGKVNVEYMYSATPTKSGRAVFIFRFDELDRAIDVLRDAGVAILPSLNAV